MAPKRITQQKITDLYKSTPKAVIQERASSSTATFKRRLLNVPNSASPTVKPNSVSTTVILPYILLTKTNLEDKVFDIIVYSQKFYLHIHF